MAAKRGQNKSQRTVFIDKPEVADSGRSVGGSGVPIPKQDSEAAREAEKAREAAFLAEHEWNGKALTGITSGRWALLLALRDQVTDIPFLVSLGGDGFFADAIRILYFCSTGPEDWRAYRRKTSAWQEEIERWGDENVPRTQRIEAEEVAFELYQDSTINRHEVAPPEKGAGSGLGN